MTKKILMCGNDACGEGAILAGCTFYAGYPITPQNELTSCMSKRMGETGGVFIQAESELAAISMVHGAAAAGVRAMTSSSSPGVSLKQEGLSYMAGCELPCVVVNVQRGGPGLGNIAPSQADYFQAVKGGGHGDYRLAVLAPASVQELMDYTALAFDIADRYRNPVMVLADGLLGQMMEPVSFKKDGHKPQAVEKPWALTGCAGRAPNVIRSLLLGDGVLEEHNKKLQEKFRKIRDSEVRFEAVNTRDADLIVVAYGSAARISRAAVEMARSGGLKAGFIRPITLWPFPEKAIAEAAAKCKKFLVVELSAGQMVEDVKLAVSGAARVGFYGRMGGGIPAEEEIFARIKTELMN
jgi:2-oxoglutarate ferredoxin oxidoreductase subunit alpha